MNLGCIIGLAYVLMPVCLCERSLGCVNSDFLCDRLSV